MMLDSVAFGLSGLAELALAICLIRRKGTGWLLGGPPRPPLQSPPVEARRRVDQFGKRGSSVPELAPPLCFCYTQAPPRSAV
ncbi:MAG TPA: hypothetical protein VF026_24660 [Ktedonobacteraceae bacterium]